jgi:hypothetical protein
VLQPPHVQYYVPLHIHQLHHPHLQKLFQIHPTTVFLVLLQKMLLFELPTFDLGCCKLTPQIMHPEIIDLFTE